MSRICFLQRFSAGVAAICAMVALGCAPIAANAQTPAGIIGAGQAAVSGFSGPIGPTAVAPGVDPAD
ncbi:MAG: hypothetical protein U1E28_09460 [Beijerinckiaceae bacterium]